MIRAVRFSVITGAAALVSAIGAMPSPGGSGSSNPCAGARFYVNPGSNAAMTAAAWRARGRSGDARSLAKIAQSPQAVWFGDWNGRDPSSDVRAALGAARAGGAL